MNHSVMYYNKIGNFNVSINIHLKITWPDIFMASYTQFINFLSHDKDGENNYKQFYLSVN